MFEALLILWRSLKIGIRHAPVLLLLNALWLASLPTVILLPLTTAALMFAANRFVYDEQSVHELLTIVRGYLWVSVRWGIITGAAIGIMVLNGQFPICLRLILLLLASSWLALQLYVWPFLLEQTHKRLLGAVANSLLLGIAAPAYTISLLFYVGSLLVITLMIFAPAALFLISYFALVGNITVIEHLRTYGRVPDPGYARRDRLERNEKEAPPT